VVKQTLKSDQTLCANTTYFIHFSLIIKNYVLFVLSQLLHCRKEACLSVFFDSESPTATSSHKA